MGIYLSEPEKTKHVEVGANEDLKLSYSAVSMQGWRRTQEDAHLIDVDKENCIGIFGVFDGHGGKEIATFCEREYVRTLKEQDSFKKGEYEKALRDVCVALDLQLQNLEGQNKVAAISNEI